MKEFIFDLQRFAEVTISKGSSQTINGVTYTAVEDALLNLDYDKKVTGISKGSVKATIEGSSAVQVTFDSSDKAFDFSCEVEDDALVVGLQGKNVKFTSGTIYCSAESFSATGEVSITGYIAKILPFNLKFDIPDTGMNITPGDETKITAPEEVDATLTFPENIAETIESLKPLIAPLLNVDEDTANKIYDVLYKLVSSPTTAQLEGTFSWNQDAKKLIINKDSTLALNILDYDLSLTAENGNVDGMSFFAQISEGDAAVGAKFTPSTDENASLDITLEKNDSKIFDGVLNITAGSIDIDILNGKTNVEKNTSLTFTQYDNTFQFTFDDAATLTYSADEKGLSKFTFGDGDGKLDLTLYRDDKAVLTANIEINGTLTVDMENEYVGMMKDTAITIKINDATYTFTATADAGATLTFQDDKFFITPGSNDGGLKINLTKDKATAFEGELNVTGGTITFDPAEQKFSFTKGTKIALTMLDGSQEIDFEITGSDASFKVEPDSEGSFTITPDTEDGSIDVTLKQNGKTVFENNLSVTGPMVFNPSTQLLTLKDGTTVSVTFNNYTLTATASGDAASSISMTNKGILITPDTTDKGKLKLTLTGTSSGSLSADIEVLSGSILFGLDGNLTVTKGTELQIDFGNDYIIKFKATNEAGGVLSLGTDGITFKPNTDEEDGGLQLTVKRGDDSRTASLDVTGSVTYKLDGTISLTKGTVVKNVFDDGNILTITANTDASGSILFNPQTGLTINPKTADALTATLTTGDLEVAKFTSIDGSITYSNGIVTAGKGTSANLRVYDTWDTKLSTSGGTSSIQFTDDRTIYTANDGATFVLDYLDDTTLEIQNGSFTDIYATETSDAIELVSVGSTFKANDEEFVFTLEKAGDYTLNGIDVTTSEDNTQVVLGGDYDKVSFAADAGITVSATEDKGFRFKIGDDGTITITTTDSGDFGVSSGSITFGDGQAAIAKGTTISMTTDDRVATFTADKNISVSSKIEDSIYYLTLDEASLNLSIAQDDKTILAGEMVIDGVFSYRPETGTFGLTGANSSHGDGNNTSLQFTTEGPTGTYTFKAETSDTTVVFVPTFSDGKFELNFPNENKNAMKFTVSKDGEEVFANNVAVNGTVGFDTTNHELSLTKDTVLTLTQGNNSMEITALGDAGGALSIVDGGLRFVPNTGDGQLELNFVSANRKANIDVTGAVIFGEGAKISLENGTVVNFTWEDGTNLKLTSKGSTGSIGLDDKGIKITSEDENLTIDFTTATGYSTTVSSIQGTIYYNAGSVIIEEGTSLTGTGSINGQAVDVTLEAQGGDGSLTFGATGMTYAAGTGALKVTLTSSSGEESTFTVNSGSVFIGSGTFQIAKGTDLATDLKDFVPALNFTTTDAGNYTINGQTIETTAESLKLTATDDYMTFVTSDDVVKYNDMTFAGNGNVSLSSSGVVLGAGVEANGFGKDKMFILAEAGNVTADARIFELTEAVPTGISVTGAQDGFIFSRTNTEESEARFDDPDPANIGKIFTEEFFLENDDAYRIQTDLLGLQKIIGVTAPSTLNATATFDDEPEETLFDLVTDSEGVFTVGEKDYTISGDSSVAIKADFEPDKSYVRGFDSLSGTVSGDFTAHEVSINGSALGVQPVNDTLIGIAADENGFEIFGLDKDASLKVSATDSYIVNGTTINANAGDYIVGLDNSAALYGVNNDTIITGTEQADYIANSGKNVTINALGGNDSIINSGDNASIDAGDGSNQITLSGASEVILLKGRTSVEGFNTGFGDGSDTIYIKPENDPAGVEFLDGGLTFGNSTASLTLSDVNTTAKVNLFHENRDMLNKGVFIAAGEWYSVESSDLSVNSGEEVYFVGTAADPKAGADFSGITADLNLTLDTAYIDSEEYVEGTPFWVNGVYSVKGGAGDTTITGSKLDDTIIAGSGNTTIDAGAGSNQIKLSDDSNDVIVFNGQTTVEGFKTGFGEGADTIYIPEEYPGVDYKNGVLTFYDDTNSLTFKDITSTAQITTYYAANGTTDKQVYIADNEWYKVTDGEAQYYIGATASKNHGIDFSGITRSINVTLDTADEANDESTWINNVYSIRGGDGLTTITGSEKSDTILAGTGETTITGGAGDDLISLSGNAALITYTEGDGNDTIYGFDSTATLSPDGTYKTQVSGNDLIVTIGESKITLIDAANLSSPNITSSNPLVQVVEAILKRTPAGYPVIAGLVFNPEEITGPEPTNYVEKEDWTITSADNLELYGVHYTPEKSNDKWVVLVHGYGCNYESMNPFATFYLANNYNVLMIDQRAAGKSEGIWLTMGVAESQDVALWTQEIVNRYPDSKITLHGVSMGAATALLAAARSDIKNVTAIVEDCGYSDVLKTFDTIVAGHPELAALGISSEIVPLTDPVSESLTGYYLHDAAPINSIDTVKKPTLFISGDDDGVAPVSMLHELYDASGAEVKEKFIVEGAGHARAGLDNPVGYSNTVFRFLSEANGEGWENENIFDDISLRGTKYNDTLSNGGDSVTIDSGDGDDYISNIADNVSIDAGAGDDTIYNHGDNITIVGGTGDDSISNNSENVLFIYNGGNDTIYGYNETSKLSISGEYSSIKVGDDVIFKVGNDSLTVVDASSVVATDFEDGESILLTEKGVYSIDGKVFELTKSVPDGVTITGESNGFTSAITEGDGKIFVEEFIAQDDDSYTVQANGKGLQTISGIDAGTTVTTSATKDGEESKNLIYIVTEDAGDYTLNDMKITTTKANTALLLGNEEMAFDADAGVEYGGKTFSGDGRVAVSVDSMILGSSVSATGFDKGESFILAQKGSATVDGRVFELTEDISDGMTIESADNGYTFSHTITQKEVTQNNLPSSYAGKIDSENVVVEGDETYNLRADTFGLRRVRGISDGATILGGDMSVDGNSNDKYAKDGQYFYVDTDTEGVFTIGEKTYSISGDSNVEIVAEFLPEKSYASGFNNLDGTVRGEFDGETFYVNGNKPILVEGDEDFYVVGSSSGTKLYDISDGASIEYAGGVKEVHTDTEGTFQFGEENNTVAVTVQGDDNVTFELNSAEYIKNIADVEGDLIFSETSNSLFINGMGGTFEGDFSSIGAYDNSLYIHDVADGAKLTTGDADKIWLQMLGETMTLNGNRMTLTDDSDGIWLRDKKIVGLDEGASLQVSKGGTYTANETSLKAKAGDVIIGLENDAYIYDANNPLITRNTSNEEIINHFKPKNYTVASGAADIELGGGDLAIVKDTSEQVNITAGDDTIVSQGENVRVTLTPEKNTWLFPIDGKMTLEGYDEATDSGFGTTYKNILSEIEKGNVDFNNGILKLGSAQVDMSKSSELMNFFNRYGRQEKVGFASQSDSLDVSDKTDDLLLVAKKNSTVKSGSGDDTILASEGSFVDGGAGKNLVKSDGATVALNGRTTVKGEVDTVYIEGADPAVDFKANGLTFYDKNAGKYLTFDGVHSTKKLNLYYADSNTLGAHVFIADDDWYNVSDGAAQYYVGATAKKNHGIDFSEITEDLNITLNTDYAADTNFWINNIHSIKGGAGNTTIIGSDKNDTILAGSGEQNIYGGAGVDKMYGNTDADKNSATFYYMPGDGRDSISNFDFMTDAQDVTADKVQLDNNSAITDVLLRGDDVMLKVDNAEGFLMLEGAQGKSFRVNDDLIAKVDTNVEFDGFTNCYVGIGAEATLTVGKGLGNVEVWLSDDSLEYHGKMYDGNFAVLDASQSDGNNILAGNELNNSIIGGVGQNSLWGGYTSSNDTLVGGAGQNTFFYGAGNGRDKIQNAHDGDVVHLEDITLDQIADANITSGGVILNFNDGGSLTIDGTADVTYQLADGSRYSADHATQDWVQK